MSATGSTRVRARRVLIVPPEINKFYVLDLAPGRSLVEAAVAAGQQVFTMPWRNRGRELIEDDGHLTPTGCAAG